MTRIWHILVICSALFFFHWIAADACAASTADHGSGEAQVRVINHQIARIWQEYDLEPSPPAAAGEWCRRVYLDVLGRIPTLDELERYLADRSGDKKVQLVRRLLYDEEYTEEYARNWTTIWTNLLIGRTKQKHEIGFRAHAHKFVEEVLPLGYQTVVGPNGKRLSGGQRQRIVLARAILRDPEILLLDEATSQIDVESEQLIHQALSQFVRGRTTVMITHRLASLCLADRILVLDNGRIVDIGTHEDLINRCHVYQRLHEIQFRASA